jgi:LPS O-antigen subunit length determinant protein (WzzB/FepE family)
MNNNNLLNHDDEIDFKALFFALWSRKLLITSITSLAAIISVLYALSLPNLYISSAMLAPSESKDSSMSSNLGGLSSMAGLAGINLSSSGSQSDEAIARIKSYDFFVEQFLPNINLDDLVKAKNWDKSSNKVIYDISDSKSIRKVSNQEAFEVYRSILSLSVDTKTSFTIITIEHVSPYIAQQWLKIIIKSINDHMRELDKDLAKNSIEFLKTSYQETNLTEIKKVISKLIQNQIQTLTLAEVNKDYIFKQIVSPIAPEKKSSPSRSMICILGTFSGFMISILFCLSMHFIRLAKD